MRKGVLAAIPVALTVAIVLLPRTEGWAVSPVGLRLMGQPFVGLRSAWLLVGDEVQAATDAVRVSTNDSAEVRRAPAGSGDNPASGDSAGEARPAGAGSGGTTGDRCTNSFSEGDDFKGPYPLCPP